MVSRTAAVVARRVCGVIVFSMASHASAVNSCCYSLCICDCVVVYRRFYAGRNSTAMRKPVEMSPFQDFLAGTTAGVSLTLVGHPFDTIKGEQHTPAH